MGVKYENHDHHGGIKKNNFFSYPLVGDYAFDALHQSPALMAQRFKFAADHPYNFIPPVLNLAHVQGYVHDPHHLEAMHDGMMGQAPEPKPKPKKKKKLNNGEASADPSSPKLKKSKSDGN